MATSFDFSIVPEMKLPAGMSGEVDFVAGEGVYDGAGPAQYDGIEYPMGTDGGTVKDFSIIKTSSIMSVPIICYIWPVVALQFSYFKITISGMPSNWYTSWVMIGDPVTLDGESVSWCFDFPDGYGIEGEESANVVRHYHRCQGESFDPIIFSKNTESPYCSYVGDWNTGDTLSIPLSFQPTAAGVETHADLSVTISSHDINDIEIDSDTQIYELDYNYTLAHLKTLCEIDGYPIGSPYYYVTGTSRTKTFSVTI